MSVRKIYKESSEKINETLQKKTLQHQNLIEKAVVFRSDSKSIPMLSDSDFPSLNESTGRTSNTPHFIGGALKYSDKLKSQSSSGNAMTVPERFHIKCDAVVTNMYSQLSDKTVSTKSEKFVNRKKADSNANQNFVTALDPNSSCEKSYQKSDAVFTKLHSQPNDKTFRTNSQRSTYKIKAVGNSNQNPSKQFSNQSAKGHASLNEAHRHSNNKKELAKPIHPVNTSPNLTSVSNKSHGFVSNNSNLFSTSIQSNRYVKPSTSEHDESSNTQSSSKAKKKQKRKSKVKRQVALQSGKITVLTPEVHMKILGQTNAPTRHFQSVFTDINDEEEYPELGKPVLPTSQKENILKKSIPPGSLKETVDESADVSIEKSNVAEGAVEESLKNVSVEKKVIVAKGKSDTKDKVHTYDPITILLNDMIQDKNPKPKMKETKTEDNLSTFVGLPKIKTKKNMCHPHNLLDSSSPAVKRGKEREKPKQKKPSLMKKIILLDRKARKEQLLQTKSSTEEENITDDTDVIHTACVDEDNDSDTEKTNLFEDNFEEICLDISELNEVNNQVPLLLTENTNLINLEDELTPSMEHLNLIEVQEHFNTVNNIFSIPNEDAKMKDLIENSNLNLSVNEISENKNNHELSEKITKPTSSTAILRSPDSLLSNLIGNVKSEVVDDKLKAAKLVLHTRNFREYCNHLISKDIDDAVYALLDDLARFQDRLHQKDPIKARMKRRMIYGVKEVRKHIKLRKLKCIIIAVDIENVEAQGGLNDVLNDIKMSAADHHIPCVFALSRKLLGKVCRKPVPVSCVGVFNYEGSEVNFRKMVELQTQSKTDYDEIFNKLLLKITDEEAVALLKAKKEAPETLRIIRTDILNNFFLPCKDNKIENENVEEQTSEEMSDVINCET